MQVREAGVSAKSTIGFHHSTRPLAPGESLPALPSLLEQVMACRNAFAVAPEDDSELIGHDEEADIESDDE